MWHGVHTAMVTPFAEDEVDLPAWRGLVRRQVDAGVHGIVVVGTTGESPAVDTDERELLLKSAMQEVDGAVPVTMGVGTNVTRSTVANCEAALRGGAAAGLLVLPYYNKPSPAGLRAHVRAACETGLPQIVYHVPGRTGQRLPVDLLGELCSERGVVAVKEATGDLLYDQDLLAACSTPILSGDDFTWLPLLAVGGAGVISVVSNLAPSLTVRVWEAWQRGDVRGARTTHARLHPVVKYLFAEASPGPCKMALAAMDLCRTEMRLPMVETTPPPVDLLVGLA
jgi:4-hydroxy-tetrahydrodipicolinate synthase